MEKPKNKRPNIRILAKTNDKIYEIGEIKIAPNGEIFFHYSINDKKIGDLGLHHSRHNNCRQLTMSKISMGDLGHKISKRIKAVPLSEFRGIEYFPTIGFHSNSLDKIHKESNLKEENNGIFIIDLTQYGEGTLNLASGIVTEEGLSQLYTTFQDRFKKKQIYTYLDNSPWVFIVVAEAISSNEPPHSISREL